ncbi:MAG: hypothetical protein ACYS74_13945, partial [Planctomycetota bacterium]
MKPGDEIENDVKRMFFKAGPEMNKDLWVKISKTQDEPPRTILASSQHSIGRAIMRSPITKLAAAAAIIIAVYHVSRPIGVTAPVFADVMEQVGKARSVTYKHTFFPGESWESANTEMIVESGVMRVERPNGDIVISDLGIGKTLHLMPDSKRATLTQRASGPKEGRLFNYLDWISTIHEEGVEFTGQKEVNGKMTNVFTASSDKMSVWV